MNERQQSILRHSSVSFESTDPLAACWLANDLLLMTTDEIGIVITVSSKCAEMFGYAVADLVGQNVAILMPAPFNEVNGPIVFR